MDNGAGTVENRKPTDTGTVHLGLPVTKYIPPIYLFLLNSKSELEIYLNGRDI
jgi:hypothetical protein